MTNILLNLFWTLGILMVFQGLQKSSLCETNQWRWWAYMSEFAVGSIMMIEFIKQVKP